MKVVALPIACLGLLLSAGAASACGLERWPEKTLTDRRASLINLTPKATSVDALLRKRVVRDPRGYRARGVERTVFKVAIRLVGFKTEDDGDIHLIVASTKHAGATMNAELPASECTHGARARWKMASARRAFIRACGQPTSDFTPLHGRATLTGVGFFDFVHGQTGGAPNGIELHPLLSFVSRSCHAA
jgi:hypothetical protein